MGQSTDLDAVITRMTTDFLAHNNAARVLRRALDEAGVGFVPVMDHLTIRTMDIDRRAGEFMALGYGYDETLQYEDWFAKVYRLELGIRLYLWIRPTRTTVARPASFRVGYRSSAIRCFTTWRCEWKTLKRPFSS